jgi:uncharacterized membrane protein
MQSLIDMLKAWQLHPVADHFTVALVVIAILVDLGGSLFSSRLWLRNMAVTLMVFAAIAAFASQITGGWEADRVWDSVNGPGKAVLERHAWLGDKVLPWVIAGLAVWRLGVQFLGFLSGTRLLYLLAAVIVGGVVIYQGSLGGELVYTYGVGTALLPSPNASPSGAAAAASPEATASAATPIPTVYAPSAMPTPGELAPSPSMTSTPPAAAPAPTPSSSAASPEASPSSASPAGASPAPTSRTL